MIDAITAHGNLSPTKGKVAKVPLPPPHPKPNRRDDPKVNKDNPRINGQPHVAEYTVRLKPSEERFNFRHVVGGSRRFSWD